MDAIQILQAMSEDDTLAEEVLSYLSQGMFDEWDCSLVDGIGEYGFGGPELRVAAKSGLSLAKYHKEQTDFQENKS